MVVLVGATGHVGGLFAKAGQRSGDFRIGSRATLASR
jgi:hypothetical protein